MPSPSLPGSIKYMLLLVLLGVQDHHHTAGEKKKTSLNWGLWISTGPRDDSLPKKTPRINKDPPGRVVGFCLIMLPRLALNSCL